MKAFHLNVDQSREDVTEALQEHRESSQFVCVETKLELHRIVPRNHLLRVFDLLSNFRCMKQCFIKKIQSLPAQSLAALLNKQQQLDFLYLQNVTINADSQSIRHLADSFRSHKGLRKVRFWQVKPAIGTNVSLDECFSALSSIKTLEEVTLIHSSILSPSPSSSWGVVGGSLQDLCSSKSLRVLTLTFPTATRRTNTNNTATLKDEHIAFMAKSLLSNHVLKSLSIRGNNLGKLAGDSIANLLRNNPKLEQLRIQLQNVQHAMPVIDALYHNSNLKTLGLVLPRKEEDDEEEVTTNPTRLLLLRNQFTSKVTDLLQNGNYHLRSLDLGGSRRGFWTSYDDQEAIRFYLKTNQIGRFDLLSGGASRGQWEETLIANCGDFSILYYFLKRNPSLALSILDKLITMGPTMKETDSEFSTTIPADSRKRSREEEEASLFPPKDHKKFKASVEL